MAASEVSTIKEVGKIAAAGFAAYKLARVLYRHGMQDTPAARRNRAVNEAARINTKLDEQNSAAGIVSDFAGSVLDDRLDRAAGLTPEQREARRSAKRKAEQDQRNADNANFRVLSKEANMNDAELQSEINVTSFWQGVGGAILGAVGTYGGLTFLEELLSKPRRAMRW